MGLRLCGPHDKLEIMTFAIIETGGKQYKVSPGQKLKVEKVNTGEGDSLIFDKVLLVADGENLAIGSSYVNKAGVEARVLKHGKNEKKIVFRYHSKTRYRKKKGHRQPFAEVEITRIY
jgi:large subunit ribosomal protein L21